MLLDEVIVPGPNQASQNSTIALWHMDEDSGTVTADSASAGGNNELELAGDYTWGDGHPGSPNNVGLVAPNDNMSYAKAWSNPDELTYEMTTSTTDFFTSTRMTTHSRTI